MGQGKYTRTAVIGFGALFLYGCSGSGSEQGIPADRIGNPPVSAPDDSQLMAALDAEFARLGIDPGKVVASAPSGERNSVNDLQVEQMNPEGADSYIRLSWTERLAGDFDQNGEVAVSDLTALGQNYLKSVDYLPAAENNGIADIPSGDSGSGNHRLARVDGDGNGEINLADVSVIAQHFGERLEGYRIYRKAPGEDSFSMIANPQDGALPYTIGRGDALGGGSSAVHFRFDDPVSLEGGYDYFLAGFGSGGEGSSSHAHGGDGPGCGPGDDPALEFAPPPAPEPDPDPNPDPEPEPDPDPAPNPLPDFGGTVLLIRNDGDSFNANYDAIVSDLDDLSTDYEEIDYYDGVDDYFLAGDYDLAIWYRGGPGGSETTLQESVWAQAELDNIHDILSGDGDLLLLSQNHQMGDCFFINSWDAIPGYSVVSTNTLAIEDRWFVWMSGLSEDDGVGFGGAVGFLPTAPFSVLGSIDSSRVAMDINGTGSGDGEFYTGTDSSGQAAWQLSLPDDTQFMSIGYYDPIFGGSSAGAGFRTGLGFFPLETMDPPMIEGLASAFTSWGCTSAPYGNIGFYPSYNLDDFGSARFWVIGYAWNDVEIKDDPSGSPSGMVRAELLLNTMAWLMQ
ncbi:hypothetical protein KDL44_04430 [bacterium]|nr:hypothetical protein [bacterium]